MDDESYYPDSSKMIIGCMQQPAGHRPITHEGKVIENSNDYFDCLEYQENQFEIKKIYKDSAGNWNILMPDDDGYHEL